MIIKDTSNITVTEALEMGLKFGGKFNHYIVNQQNGKVEKIRYGRVIGIYKYFFMASFKGKKGYECRECLPYYLLKNQDKAEKIQLKK